MKKPKVLPRLSFTIEEATEATGLARSRLFVAIADGSLHTFKAGRRRMVSARALEKFIEILECAGDAKTLLAMMLALALCGETRPAYGFFDVPCPTLATTTLGETLSVDIPSPHAARFLRISGEDAALDLLRFRKPPRYPGGFERLMIDLRVASGSFE